MNREQLNRIRRMAGVAQDFTAPTQEELHEAGGLGQYSGMGATTSGPDNHVHPDEKEMADAINGRDEVEDDNGDHDDQDFETNDDFQKGDHVKCHGEECVVVVADAKADFVVVAPLGSESDMDALKMVSAGELEKLEGDHEDHADADEDMGDDVEVDAEVDAEDGMDGEEEPAMEMAHARQRDTKVTPSLSQSENKRNKKAMRSKERQQGKKAAMVAEGFKKGDHVMCKGKKCIVKVPDGKADFIGVVPADDPKAKVDMVRASELKTVKESMHYYTDDNYETFANDKEKPTNDASAYPSVFDDPDFEEEKEDYEMGYEDDKVSVPAAVLGDLKTVIEDCKKEADKAERRDHDERKHYYADTADALQIVHDYLSEKTIEGLKRAQLMSHRMANVSRALMPDHVWKFIVEGGAKRSLKDYVNDVKGMGYPKLGARNTLDDNN